MTERIEKIYCSRCSKCMTNESSNTNFVGVHLSMHVSEASEADKEFVDRQLGKYAFGNRVWRFCWECWIDSLFQAAE